MIAKDPLRFLDGVIRPPDRPFFLDLGLAVGIFCAWLALSGFEPLIAAAADELRLAVTTGEYRLQLPIGPAAVGIAGLVLSWVRYRFLSGGQQLQDRLRSATLLAVVLLALRLVSLLDPIVYVFPFLTLLWSPHTLWAVALVFLGYVHLPPANGQKGISTGYTAGSLLVFCLPLYFLYTLYFCQVTMLHGDEGQYLRVTQSLLHDGDMDLANNLDAEHIGEYHVSHFGVNKAPASPEGKVHSVHPIGLSVALVPAYWLGLEQWKNPRLATALFMALLASLCVPLTFLFLRRLGVEFWASLLATGTMAVTAPFFLFTNQLYPEIPALLIALVALVTLAHWQIPGGSYRSWGKWEVPLLGLLTLLLCCLPFLHPRLAPLGLLCGAGVLLQAWYSPRRYPALSVVGLVVVVGLYVLISFHYAFSGDWMGPLRPGSGAWGEDALDIANWSISLPGHFLHVDKGILNSSPIYFFALFGLVALARMRDRRVVVAVSIYSATAVINGLHSNWDFGYCFPARFLVTALPVLVLGLAWGLTLVKRSAATTFFAAFSLAISVEGVLDTLLLPEDGYDGKNLEIRSINHYYPLNQHFFHAEQVEMPLLDIAFWALLLAALFFRDGMGFGRSELIRWGSIAAAAFAPFLWNRSVTAADRLGLSLSPYMISLSDTETTAGMGPREFNFPITLNLVAESDQTEGSFYARPGVTSAGMVSFSRPPKPIGASLGTYELTFPGLRVKPPDGQVSGHIVLTRGYTIPAVSYWGHRTSFPLIGGNVDENREIQLKIEKAGIERIICEYSGHGELALDGIQATFTPSKAEPSAVEIKRFAPEIQEGPLQIGVRFSNLPAGHYRVHLNLAVSAGSAFRSFFERHPVPFRTAVSSGSYASQWFSSKLDKGNWATVKSPDYQRPMEEGMHPPWLLSVPIVGDRARQLKFVLNQTQDIFCLMHYDGPADLELTDIVLYWEIFD
ncbi:MAG: hypothetical protein OXG96_05775 [Acidobacteria bacterium]|nr:hypothetical protein [Acidobacteriota bacterium]